MILGIVDRDRVAAAPACDPSRIDAARLCRGSSIALFLALAINPLVEDGFRTHAASAAPRATRSASPRSCSCSSRVRRSASAALFIPTLVDNVNKFVDAVPGYVDDSRRAGAGSASSRRSTTSSRRSAGADQQRRREAVLGFSGAAVSVTKGVVNIVLGAITIIVPDLLHAARGPGLGRALLRAPPARVAAALAPCRPRHLRQVGGYVTGNLLISFIAGIADDVRAARSRRSLTRSRSG